jgi:glycosyltransferase involved in cell wall biosynthesis
MPLTCALCSKKTATFAILGGAALALHYPQFQADTTGHWESSAWVALPFFGLVLLSEWRHRHHLLRERGTWVERFSVVTPVLNEADNLKAIGPWIQQHRDVIRDWIVVDGGSNDDSVALARQFGAQVQIATTRGRGHQIHQGLQAAKEDWVVICHADSRYPQGFFKALQNRIATGPLLEGGAFRMVYRDIPKMGILLFLNDLKTRWLGISFGDQTQFIHRPSLQKRGGFPKLALMEDLELSLRWKGGHVCYLTNTLSITSARKWDRDGRIKNAWLIIQLLAAYLWQRHWHPPVDVSRLYQRYYRS